MSYMDRAIKTLQAAEHELRSVITEAAAAQAYRDVASIANIADGLAALLREVSSDPVVRGTGAGEIKLFGSEWPDSVRASAVEHAAALHTRSPKLRRDQYPHFYRDDDRLVKVAWSKKERRPYEHRAPREVIQRLIDVVRKRKGEGKVFEAGAVMPILAENGDEYPSYQSYLALSWLRQTGVITKMGRDGYVLKPGAATAEKLEKLWNALPVVE